LALNFQVTSPFEISFISTIFSEKVHVWVHAPSIGTQALKVRN
jgi:hypothetical protein